MKLSNEKITDFERYERKLRMRWSKIKDDLKVKKLKDGGYNYFADNLGQESVEAIQACINRRGW